MQPVNFFPVQNWFDILWNMCTRRKDATLVGYNTWQVLFLPQVCISMQIQKKSNLFFSSPNDCMFTLKVKPCMSSCFNHAVFYVKASESRDSTLQDMAVPPCLIELGYCADLISGGKHSGGRKHHLLIKKIFSWRFKEKDGALCGWFRALIESRTVNRICSNRSMTEGILLFRSFMYFIANAALVPTHKQETILCSVQPFLATGRTFQQQPIIYWSMMRPT